MSPFLPELLRGPTHVAELIMEAQREEGRILNDEQQSLFAPWVDELQEAFKRRPHPEDTYLALDRQWTTLTSNSRESFMI